jgi:hypothetical protein
MRTVVFGKRADASDAHALRERVQRVSDGCGTDEERRELAIERERIPRNSRGRVWISGRAAQNRTDYRRTYASGRLARLKVTVESAPNAASPKASGPKPLHRPRRQHIEKQSNTSNKHLERDRTGRK